MILKKYYKTEAEFTQLHARLKLMNCPHCRHSGFLILHGCLYGLADTKATQHIKRGHRIFCSNRKQRKGCGRTFSILIAAFIQRFRIPAKALWRFLDSLMDGKSKVQAFQDSGTNLDQTNTYRIYQRFRYNQGRIRTYLSRIKDPPQPNQTNTPALLTILHLKSVFLNSPCPVSQFQHYFQASFLQ